MDFGSALVIPPPPGEVVDLSGAMTAGQKRVLIVYIIGLVLATITIVLRLYTRLAIVRKMGLDDCTLRLLSE